MKLRTEVHIPDSDVKLETKDCIFSIGSCFATEMSTLLKKGQIQTATNPFGTLFNPYSINNAIQKLHDSYFYSEHNLIVYNDEYISLDHHTSFDSRYLHQTLEKINAEISTGNQFLQKTNWVIITYGSAFVYEFLPKKIRVSNCHKIPQKYFEKQLMSHSEIVENIRMTIANLRDICSDDVQILFTVSPVRHTKDGMVENQLSKSKLIAGIHDALQGQINCHYLPIYEIMMDDLRDYRFYQEDMIHPSTQAIQYIFEKFGNAYFSEETKEFIQENFAIAQSLSHRPSNENDPKYLEFRKKLETKIALQQSKVKHKIFD